MDVIVYFNTNINRFSGVTERYYYSNMQRFLSRPLRIYDNDPEMICFCLPDQKYKYISFLSAYAYMRMRVCIFPIITFHFNL